MPGAIGSLILFAAIAVQAPAAAGAPAESRTALVGEMQALALAHGKYDDKIPASILEGLQLNGGNAGYAECLVAWQDDSDNSYHAIVAGLDKQDVILSFKPADDSYAINWRLDATGKLLATVRSDKAGNHELANDLLADRLDAELDYWRVHLPDEEKERAGWPACAPPVEGR